MIRSTRAGFYQIDDIRAALVDLEYGFGLDARGGEAAAVPARGQQLESQLRKSRASGTTCALIVVVDAEENRALARQALPGGELRLGEGLAEAARDAHDFAGRAHLRARGSCPRRETC